MVESLLSRIKRIVSGSIEDTCDRMERAGGATVMREALREVERVVAEAKTERDEATARRLQAVRRQGLYRERLTQLQQKAEFAMDQGREDLAEAALLRQVEFGNQIEALAAAETEAADEERRLEQALASLALRKAQMEEELKAFTAARRDAGLAAEAAPGTTRDRERRVERAEAAFERAMSGLGVTTGITGEAAETAARLGEIDQMMRRSVIAERMEALRRRAG